MSLSDRLKKRSCPSEVVTIDGERFRVTGLSLNATAAITAKSRKKDGKLDGEKMDRLLLEACVSDTDDGSSLTAEEWGQQPRAFTGPLMSEVMRLCGMDKDDIDRDPKDSGSTGN